MSVIHPAIFRAYPQITAAQSTRLGGVSPVPFGMNLSSHVGDDKENVAENRRRFFTMAGLEAEMTPVYQHQIHSANVNVITRDWIEANPDHIVNDSDALITAEPNVVLCVSIADCTPVLLYDQVRKVIAAIHAGWRGTEQMIVLNTIRRMHAEFGTDPKDLVAFIGASASKGKYEVGMEVATLFEKQHIEEISPISGVRKFLLDVKAANYDQLKYAGVMESNIEISNRCTISDPDLHSYRRDGKRSGRMLAIIGRRAGEL